MTQQTYQETARETLQNALDALIEANNLREHYQDVSLRRGAIEGLLKMLTSIEDSK